MCLDAPVEMAVVVKKAARKQRKYQLCYHTKEHCLTLTLRKCPEDLGFSPNFLQLWCIRIKSGNDTSLFSFLRRVK